MDRKKKKIYYHCGREGQLRCKVNLYWPRRTLSLVSLGLACARADEKANEKANQVVN